MPLTPGAPDWWATRLHRELRLRKPGIERLIRYYKGQFPDPWLPEQAQEEFSRVLALTGSNYMGLVVDATAERMKIVGFRRDGRNDTAAWRTWQFNNLDRFAHSGIREAVKTGVSYLLVAPPRADGEPARITVEHPLQAIVERDPSDPMGRLAGFKQWFDPHSNRTMATLYLPDAVYKWEGSRGSSPARWDARRVDGEDWPAVNPLGVVPMLELPNNPDLFGDGVSEIADVLVIQDRINKTIVDRLMTQDFGAFPQKWATGFPDDEDQDSADNSDGPPIDIGRNRLVVARGEGSEKVKFGQFTASALDPYSGAKQEDVKDVAARTRVPPQYLLGELVNISDSAMKAAESGLVAKVLDLREPYGDGHEEGQRLAGGAEGDAERAQDRSLEATWRNPEFRTEGQLVDALVKMDTLGVPKEALWERWGATPQEIERWKQMEIDRNMRLLGSDVASLIGGPKAPMPVDELERRSEVYGQLIRAGVTHESAAAQAGLAGMAHTGDRPVTTREDAA